MPPPEKNPRPPRPKPPKPKPTASSKTTGPLPDLPQRDITLAGVPPRPDPFACVETCSDSCAFYNLCPPPLPPPPSSPSATVHISSGRLPTPLIALSASLLTVSALLLLAILLHRLLRRRRRRARAALAAQLDEEEGGGHHVLAGAVAEEVGDEEEDADGGGVHHVWYIRTKGLDERAIAAIAAVVYDSAGKKLAGDDGSCAVCLAEFTDGETLRLLPRCRHAFHRGCIDTWLRAHVNCPLCRAPVQITSAAAVAVAADAMAAPGGEQPGTDLGSTGVPRGTDGDGERGGRLPERAVRRAASMVAMPPRRAWPGVSSFRAPASSSGREEDMMGLGKIMRILKFSDAVEMAGVGVGRSASFSVGCCQRAPVRSGTSATGVSSDEMPR